ncbi:MAG TPA: hypothetical protein VGP07_05245 [Polyangia bacterium]|jgi:hypothetical protein
MNQASRRFGLLVTGLFGLAVAGCGNNAANPDSGTDTPIDQTVDAPDQAQTTGALVLDSPTLTVVEGDALGGTFTVGLSKPFPTPVTVSVITSDRTVASVAQDSLVFAANDVTPQTVTVFGTPDDDTDTNSTLITLSSPDAGSTTIRVTVTDVNKQAIVVSPTQVFMQQGASTQVGVRLAFRPSTSAPVTVTVASPDPTVLTVSPTTLTFPADSTYSIDQQVTLTAIAGAIAGEHTVNVSLSATGVDTVLPLPVVISDPNTLGLVVTPGSLSLTEGGTAGTVMVSLTKAPPTDLAVSVTSTSSAQALPSPVGLTFTASNFATPQAVTITPQANNDPKDEVATITFAVTTAVTPSVAPRTVTVTITTGAKQAINVLPTAVTLSQGTSTTFDVWMAFNPGAAITVNAFSSNPSRVTVTPPTLIFNASNFGTHQAVTVQGLAADDLADVLANITLTSQVANMVIVPVTVKNSNSQAIQVVYGTAPGTIVMQETQAGGVPSTASFGVSLAYNPGANVNVTLTGSDNTRLTVSKSTLTFTATNGKTTQFVTLTSIRDTDLVDNDLTLTVSSPGLKDVTVPIIILDSDVERVTVTKGGAPLTSIDDATELSGATSFDLGLTLTPPVAVAVTLTSSDTTRAMVPASVSLSTTAPVTVPITLLPDLDARQNVVVITMHVTNATLGIPDRTLMITIKDKDTQAIMLGAGGALSAMPSINLTLHERSATNADGLTNTATFFVALQAQPDTDNTVVTLSVSPAASDGIMLSASSLTFTTADYGAKMVTVTGVGDANLTTDVFSIRVSSSGLGVSDQFVDVTEIDDDKQTLVVSPMNLNSLVERAASTSFTVRLTNQPPTMTTVTVTVPPALAGSFGISSLPMAADPAPPGAIDVTAQGSNTLSLVFSPGSGAGGYDTAQTVYVKAINDVNTNNESGSIDVSLPSFAGSQPVTVASSDIDVQGIILKAVDPSDPLNETKFTDPSNVTVNENSQNSDTKTYSQTFAVKLRFPPHGSTAQTEDITIASSNTVHLVVSQPAPGPATLSFNGASGPGGWNSYQFFTITSVADTNVMSDPVTVTLKTGLGTSSDPYTAPQVSMPVIVNDLDVGIVVTPANGGSTKEDGSNPLTFKVNLSRNPPAGLTVDIGNSDSTRVMLSATSLSFSTTNGTTQQSFNVTGLTDADMISNSVTLTLSSTALPSNQNLTIPITVTEP